MMQTQLTNFRYGPILGLDASRVQCGFYSNSALNIVGREVLGNLHIESGDVPEQVYDRFSVQAHIEEQIRFIERQLQVAASFSDRVTNWINLMPQMLTNKTFIEKLSEILLRRERSFLRTTYSKIVTNVGFEIVERGELSAAAVIFIQRLCAAGYPVALDDVGAPGGLFATGEQVTLALKRLPVSKLKIDSSLVIGQSPSAVLEVVTLFLLTVGSQQMKSVKEITIEGVPVNPHADDLQPEMFKTERAKQLFVRYNTKAAEWRMVMKDLERYLKVVVTVQLAPVVYADLA